MDVTIRQATLADAEGIARVDLETHVEAYRPILGEDYLEGVTLQETVDRWRRILAKDTSVAQPPDEVLVAERDGFIIAYAGIGASRDADGDGIGEIYTVYVHPSAWRGGIGSQVLTAAAHRLHDLGYSVVTLWVLDLNERAQAFYASQGWQPDGTTEPARGRPNLNLRYRAPADA